MVVRLSGTQPQGPKHQETLENKTVDGTQNNVRTNRGSTQNRPSSPVIGDLYFNTDINGMENYTANGWSTIAAAPQPPTNVVATNTGSGRVYNNGRASVSFSPATTGGAANSFTVTSNPGSYTATGASSPIIITGLQSGVSTTFLVTATNSFGSATSTSPSSPINITTVPETPGTPTANTLSPNSVQLSFTPSNSGGEAITSYNVTSTPSVSLSVSGNSSPLTITGNFLTDTNYTFTISAVNSNGSSQESSSSNIVSPATFATISGGTLTSNSTHYFRSFTSNDTLTITGKSINADILMVGGGGGAGWDAGGGGGGGGVIIATSKNLTTGSYNIVIGNGGNYNTGAAGSNGGSTTGFGLTALGGGGGGYYANNGPGLAGGSGGGGASTLGAGGAATQTSGSGYTGYGFPGGSGASSSYGSGGGGGAGGPGANGVAQQYVSGGLPLYSSNFNENGTSIGYAGGGYGNYDSGDIMPTGQTQNQTVLGYYGFGANGMGLQSNAKNANPGIVVVKYSKNGIFEPSSISNLYLWLDSADVSTFTYSSGSYISQWSDKSGNSYHATQSDTSKQPVRAVSPSIGVDFDGGDVLNTSASYNGNIFTQFLVVRDASGGQTPVGSGTGGTSNIYWPYLSGNDWYYQIDTSWGLSTNPQPSGLYIIEIRYNGNGASNSDRMAARFQGVEQNLSYTGNIPSTLSRSGATTSIGGYNPTPILGWSGVISELITYNKVLSTDELSKVRSYLNDKWKVSA